MAVIDASVYVALINVHERDHVACWAWFQREQAQQHPMSAPIILLPEIAAALSRGLGDPMLAHRVVQHLLHTGLVELVPIGSALAQQAAAIAADHHIRGSNAVYVALAEHLDTELITLNQQQLERGRAIVRTRRP